MAAAIGAGLPGRRADRQHGRRHRRRHHRGGRDLAGRHRRRRRSVRVGGDELDDAIINYVKKEYTLADRPADGRGGQARDRVRVPARGGGARRDPRPRPRLRPAEDRRAHLRGGPRRARGAAGPDHRRHQGARSTRPRRSWRPTSWIAASCSPAAARSCRGSDERLREETQMPAHRGRVPAHLRRRRVGRSARGVRGDPQVQPLQQP